MSYDSAPFQEEQPIIDAYESRCDAESALEPGDYDDDGDGRWDDDEDDDEEYDDSTPPDYGPRGSGAVIIEYYGDEPGLEDEF